MSKALKKVEKRDRLKGNSWAALMAPSRVERKVQTRVSNSVDERVAKMADVLAVPSVV